MESDLAMAAYGIVMNMSGKTGKLEMLTFSSFQSFSRYIRNYGV